MKYQAALIFFALLVLFGVAVFIYREMFPEYKTYQHAYQDLEKFRSTQTHEPLAPFEMGIKQIMLPNKTNGPEIIDRCTSCHLAMNLPHFSPTAVALDINDQPLIDGDGNPVLEPNPNYVFTQVRSEINKLDVEGKSSDKLKKLLFAEKALQMHPLIGKEMRPFESHPIDEYGCTTCHSGNGRALVVDRAHGPLYDNEYELWDPKMKKPQFLEIDPNNDPKFARSYNNKPSHELVFQTTPLFIGPLIEAKCAQCHQTTSCAMSTTLDGVTNFEMEKQKELIALKKALVDDKNALKTLLELHNKVSADGREKTLSWLNSELSNPKNSAEQIDAYEGQYAFVKEHEETEFALFSEATRLLGSESEAQNFFEGKHYAAGGLIGEKEKTLARMQPVVELLDHTKEPLFVAGQDKQVIHKMRSNLDRLMSSYQRGQELFVSQACYACHRIAGFSRAAVGPELTTAGLNYPWYIKESIVWPQADLPSSTMPNFHLDHGEIEDLMAFLMAQTGNRKVASEIDHRIALDQWEMGEKMPWEQPVPPTHIKDLSSGLLTYATEGCAACHKLDGVTSKYRVEDEHWFSKAFPFNAAGSIIATAVMSEKEAIDTLIIDHGSDEILEEIEKKDPGLLAGFYSNFQFAKRALHDEKDQERLHKVLMAYIQTYGLGRDIAPPLNWSGVYRDPSWLLGHFHNPPGFTAKSIMPVMPFDDTKFYMLDDMLYVLGEQNQQRFQKRWTKDGFKPAEAYNILCASCHGPNRQGNGLVAEWIYPIPKNLRDPVFLGNLTKERAIDSITHGVMGTPMPPWGEAVEGQKPVLDGDQVTQLVDWIYQGLPPNPRADKQEEKWSYTPQDVVDEMKKEGDALQPVPSPIDVATYFETQSNPIKTSDDRLYYIRQRYYTKENLDVAREYYNVNCSVCHGKDGTGTGERSTSMIEAKPRMFTNLPWIRTRDDLRLLRSIKYGVQGTAMTPWGDQTTSALRMQLVMYIREMTRSIMLRDDLEKQVYAIFDKEVIKLNLERIPNYKTVEQLEQVRTDKILSGKVVTETSELKKAQEIDEQYLAQIALLDQLKALYFNLGSKLIAKDLPEPIIESYIAFLKTRKGEPKAVLTYLDQTIDHYQKQLDKVGINIDDPTGDAPAQKVIKEQRGYINLKTTLQSQLEHAKKLQQEYDGNHV